MNAKAKLVAHYKSLLGNPATRAAVPTRYLTAHQQAQRASNARTKAAGAAAGAYDNAPITPGSSVTNAGLARETRAAIAQQYGGQENALGTQIRDQPAQRTQVSGFYQHYIDAVNAAKTDQVARQQAAKDQTTALADSADRVSGSVTKAQLDQMQADAALRGATVDPSIAQTASNAAGIRRMLTDSFGANQVARQQTQGDLLGATAVSGEGARTNALTAMLGNENALKGQLATLKGQEGAYATTYGAKRRTDEQNAVATSALANVNQNLAAGKLAVAQQDSVTRRIAATKPAADKPYKYGYTQKEWLAMPEPTRVKIAAQNSKSAGPGNGKDAFGNTRKDIERYGNQWSKAKTQAQTVAQQKGYGGNVDKIAQGIVILDPTTPPWMAKAAAEAIALGRVGGGSARRLKSHGIAYKPKPPKPKATATPLTVPGVAKGVQGAVP